LEPRLEEPLRHAGRVRREFMNEQFKTGAVFSDDELKMLDRLRSPRRDDRAQPGRRILLVAKIGIDRECVTSASPERRHDDTAAFVSRDSQDCVAHFGTDRRDRGL
jgi:hypothetical protein